MFANSVIKMPWGRNDKTLPSHVLRTGMKTPIQAVGNHSGLENCIGDRERAWIERNRTWKLWKIDFYWINIREVHVMISLRLLSTCWKWERQNSSILGPLLMPPDRLDSGKECCIRCHPSARSIWLYSTQVSHIKVLKYIICMLIM